MPFCLGSFNDSFSDPFYGTSLGGLLLIFIPLIASVVLLLLLNGTMLLLCVEDDLARMLIGILRARNRTRHGRSTLEAGKEMKDVAGMIRS